MFKHLLWLRVMREEYVQETKVVGLNWDLEVIGMVHNLDALDEID